MSERPRFFDDLAGVAGGAFSALTGLREEARAIIQGRVDEVLASLDLVRREELDVVRDIAAQSRLALDIAEQRLALLEERVALLEARDEA